MQKEDEAKSTGNRYRYRRAGLEEQKNRKRDRKTVENKREENKQRVKNKETVEEQTDSRGTSKNNNSHPPPSPTHQP